MHCVFCHEEKCGQVQYLQMLNMARVGLKQRRMKPWLWWIDSFAGHVDSVLLGLDLTLSPPVPSDIWESDLEANVCCQSEEA